MNKLFSTILACMKIGLNLDCVKVRYHVPFGTLTEMPACARHAADTFVQRDFKQTTPRLSTPHRPLEFAANDIGFA